MTLESPGLVDTTSSPVTVEFITAAGEFSVAVRTDRAPHSAAYFLTDVDAGVFDGSSIFRIVKPSQRPAHASPIQVVQMGHRSEDEKLAPSIPHESTRVSGLNHRRGTVSLARFAPGAVYHSFFVCMRAEPGLDAGGSRHADGQGFAAFGCVTSGFDRLKQLVHKWDGDLQYLQKPLSIFHARRARV